MASYLEDTPDRKKKKRRWELKGLYPRIKWASRTGGG